MTNRVHPIAVLQVFLLCLCFAVGTQAQANPSPTPRPMPPGTTGADTNDPRAKLSAGLYDAGEAAMGIKHLLLLKKPDAFQLGTTDAKSPRVKKPLAPFEIPRIRRLPRPAQFSLPAFQLAI